MPLKSPIKLLRDVADATAANSTLLQKMEKTRLANLADQLRAKRKTEIAIAKALAEEKKKIEKECNKAVKKASKVSWSVHKSDLLNDY